MFQIYKIKLYNCNINTKDATITNYINLYIIHINNSQIYSI